MPWSFTGNCVNILYLFHLCQVYVDVVPRVIGVPLLLVLHHFLFQESHDLLVVAEDGLVRSRQVLQQAGEGVIQLWMGTKPSYQVADQQLVLCFVIVETHRGVT